MTAFKNELMSDDDEDLEDEKPTEEKEAPVNVDKNEDVIPDEDANNDISSQ